jgi:hypothetical protein
MKPFPWLPSWPRRSPPRLRPTRPERQRSDLAPHARGDVINQLGACDHTTVEPTKRPANFDRWRVSCCAAEAC